MGLAAVVKRLLRNNSNQTGVAVHILLPTAVGAVKSSGSGRTPLHIIFFSSFHIVVSECQGSLDPIVWKERCNTHVIIIARLVRAMWRRCQVTPLACHRATVASKPA